MVVFSIGYERKSISSLCALLQSSGIRRVVDVREAAWSQRPEFRREALRTALSRHNIGYVHCKQAGNPYRPRRGELMDLNQCRADFALHISRTPSVVVELERLTAEAPSALFCYEATRDRCHRGVLLDAMQARNPNLTVTDLGVENSPLAQSGYLFPRPREATPGAISPQVT